MSKKNSFISFNQKGETVKLEIRDNTYKIMHRRSYKTNDIKDLYELLTSLEKFTPYTINQIINWKNDWI